jgi:hypothetical protein
MFSSSICERHLRCDGCRLKDCCPVKLAWRLGNTSNRNLQIVCEPWPLTEVLGLRIPGPSDSTRLGITSAQKKRLLIS